MGNFRECQLSLKTQILKHGIENCFFSVPMRPLRKLLCFSYKSSSDDPIKVLAKISEEKYRIEDGYKITLKSIYPEFGQEHYYQLDLESLIEKGSVEMLVYKN